MNHYFQIVYSQIFKLHLENMTRPSENSFEMNQVKEDQENAPLHSENDVNICHNKTKDETNGDIASIEIEERSAVEVAPKEVPLEEDFYEIIFSILLPFILIGSPFNFCISIDKNRHMKFMTSRLMKVMSI